MKIYSGQEKLKELLFMKSVIRMDSLERQAIIEFGYAMTTLSGLV